MVRLLPGDWQLLFSELKPGAHGALQRLIQLPEGLASVVDDGSRDGLARWLQSHRMSAPDVQRVTGLPHARLVTQRLAAKRRRPGAG
jgi:hypothetical protein